MGANLIFIQYSIHWNFYVICSCANTYDFNNFILLWLFIICKLKFHLIICLVYMRCNCLWDYFWFCGCEYLLLILLWIFPIIYLCGIFLMIILCFQLLKLPMFVVVVFYFVYTSISAYNDDDNNDDFLIVRFLIMFLLILILMFMALLRLSLCCNFWETVIL